eukprot:968312-Alexandrium_andersonii.AAC.1
MRGRVFATRRVSRLSESPKQVYTQCLPGKRDDPEQRQANVDAMNALLAENHSSLFRDGSVAPCELHPGGACCKLYGVGEKQQGSITIHWA